jgi:hypothetical protein
MLFQHDQDRGESLATPGDRWSLTIRQVIKYESFQVIFMLFTCSVADLDPGSGAFLTPGSGMDKKSGSGIRNEQPGSYFLELRKHFLGLKYLNSLMWIRDPDCKKNLDPGSGNQDPDKHPGSATMFS